MTRTVLALSVAAVLCILLTQAKCDDSDLILVDTPEKFALLKSGAYDTKYRSVRITSAATSDVLLQPQHFWNATFRSLTFVAWVGDGLKNVIELFPDPGMGRAVAYFRHGENPLGGMPANYAIYSVYYAYPAKPNAENIDAILSWTHANKMYIHDQDDVAVRLTERSAELNALKELRVLHVAMQRDSFEQIRVAAFVENLRALHEIKFHGRHLSGEQMADFEANNRAPAGWKSWITNKLIYYRRQE